MAYVNQDFNVYEFQTVKESLVFAYEMKIGEVNEYEIDNLIRTLGLSHIENNFINKLSGGEKVRLKVGIELVGNPQIIFLDEPTSGLDASKALKILNFLKEISQSLSKTIIVTIHQPSYKMLNCFNKIHLIALGRTVYSGPIDGCIKFFKSCGHPIPNNTNPADHFLEVLSTDSSTPESNDESLNRVLNILSEWSNQEPSYESLSHKQLSYTPLNNLKFSFSKVLKRNLVEIIRNSTVLKSLLFQKTVFLLILGLTYFRFASNTDDVSLLDFRGFLTFICLNTFFGVSGPLLNKFVLEKQIVLRERQSGFYSGYVAFLAKFTSELLKQSTFEVVYLIIMIILTGLFTNLWTLIQFLIVIFGLISFAIPYALTISALAPNPTTSQVLGITINILFVLYSGAFTNPKQVNPYLSWLIYISPISYAFRALVISQSTNKNFIPLNNDVNKDEIKNLINKISGQATESNVDGTFEPLLNEISSLNDLLNNNSSSNDLLKEWGLDQISSFTVNILILFGYSTLVVLLGSFILHRATRNNLSLNK
ncbi:ABCG2 [Hepatospora eriocheir]|uniref:ABCG2 n=1 Tax=Hepatospora eriocheir TaxID=1081669 RepID=A0A1X0QFW8_9MICR|nr:ABCG2 [Hepatospora eriocheir]